MKKLNRESIDSLLLKKKKKKISEILYKIRKKLASNKQKFQSIFEEHDHQANGIVSCYTFSYLLESIFELEPTEVALLIQLVNGGKEITADKFDDVPYLSLAELLENSERLHELPLFAIQETEESIETPLFSRRVSTQNTSRILAHAKSGETGSERFGLSVPGRNSLSRLEQENLGSFFKITSITQNQLKSIESKKNSQKALNNEQSKANISQSRKSHFSPENMKVLEKYQNLTGEYENKPEIEKNDPKEHFALKEELTRQSIQIQQMAKMQREILDTLQQNRPNILQKSRQVPKSQFMSVKARQAPREQTNRDSRNLLVDSAHFNLVRSDVGFEDQASLERAKYSVFNIFQKRVSNESGTSKENLTNQDNHADFSLQELANQNRAQSRHVFAEPRQPPSEFQTVEPEFGRKAS